MCSTADDGVSIGVARPSDEQILEQENTIRCEIAAFGTPPLFVFNFNAAAVVAALFIKRVGIGTAK